MSPDLIGPLPRRRSATMDFLWEQLRREAEQALEVEPILAPLFVGTILQQRCFEHAVLYRIAARLGNEIHQAGTV